MKQVSILQYAKSRGITRQAVLKQISNRRLLPGVKKYQKIGNGWILLLEKEKPL